MRGNLFIAWRGTLHLGWMAATLRVAGVRLGRVLRTWLVMRKDPVLNLNQVCCLCRVRVSGQTVASAVT